jgi:chromosome segregation ATPase
MSSQMIIDSPQTTEHVTTQLEEIYETVNILADGIAILNEDLQRLSTESIHYQNTLDPLKQDISTLKTSIQEQNTFLDGIKINQDILQQDLASFGQKMTDIKASSFDGTFIWKISNIQEKIGQQLMFYLYD